jgi:hypothetical protein
MSEFATPWSSVRQKASCALPREPQTLWKRRWVTPHSRRLLLLQGAESRADHGSPLPRPRWRRPHTAGSAVARVMGPSSLPRPVRAGYGGRMGEVAVDGRIPGFGGCVSRSPLNRLIPPAFAFASWSTRRSGGREDKVDSGTERADLRTVTVAHVHPRSVAGRLVAE